MKAENKTVETKASVAAYLKKIKDADRRKECEALTKLMAKQSGFPPKMWGPAIIGYGSYHYVYDSGREGDAPYVGLSSRANAITLYLTNANAQPELLKKLGKYKKSGGGCFYIQKLEDIDTAVLGKLVAHSIKFLKGKYGG